MSWEGKRVDGWMMRCCEACDSYLYTLTMGVMVEDGSTGSSLLTLEAGMANSFLEVVR